MRKRIILPPPLKKAKRYKRSKEQEIKSYKIPPRYNLRCRNNTKRMVPGSLEELNDDCLIHLFQFFDALACLKLGLVNDRFERFAKECLKSVKLDVVQLREQFSLSLAEIVLAKFGSSIRKVEFKPFRMLTEEDESFTQYAEILTKYCPNVVDIICPATFFGFIKTNLLQACKETLESLEVVGYTFVDSNSYYIGQLTNLKRLLLDCTRITGKHLTQLQNLTHLELSNCWYIDPVSFEKIVENNRLKVLDIVDCGYLDTNAFYVLLDKQWDCLEELKIGYGYSQADMRLLAFLSALKHIKIYSVQHSKHDPTFLSYFLGWKRQTLKSLKLSYDYSCTLTGDELSRILDMAYLEKLVLIAFPIDKDFLIEMSKRLVNLEVLEVRPVNSVKRKTMLEVVENFKKLKYCVMYYS